VRCTEQNVVNPGTKRWALGFLRESVRTIEFSDAIRGLEMRRKQEKNEED
jgi:hypothetical protein